MRPLGTNRHKVFVRITSLRRSSRNRRHVDIRVDGGPRLSVPAEVVTRAGLRPGDELSESALHALQRDTAHWAAKEAALRLLAHRDRTRTELLRSLTAKGHPLDISTRVVQTLIEQRLVDDEAAAAALVRDRVSYRPRGTRRLVAELRHKGIGTAVASAVVGRVLGEAGITEVELARTAAFKWLRTRRTPVGSTHRTQDDPRAERRRLSGYLARRGFAPDTIRTVVQEALPPSSGRAPAGESHAVSRD